ncbi:hypothetical protein BHE74_00049024 [Ensete ventricosum]|nr:hypothetical protein GW17_00053272 [Ensete ventricosum]RWW45164.1 hypothetical protein BHE74_00049024 [Ensete ventricosum]
MRNVYVYPAKQFPVTAIHRLPPCYDLQQEDTNAKTLVFSSTIPCMKYSGDKHLSTSQAPLPAAAGVVFGSESDDDGVMLIPEGSFDRCEGPVSPLGWKPPRKAEI